jgi:putative ABC transport system permease protein
MSFILNLTIREIRSSWRRLLFFFLCIAIGVGSVVALRSLIQNLSLAVGGDARALLTADIELSSTNDFSPAELEKIEAAIGRSKLVDRRDEAITGASMARPIDESNQRLRMVELKGITSNFPMVGAFKLSDGTDFDFKYLEGRGAIVSPLLLEDLAVNIGEKIIIGEETFEIRGTFESEPGGSGGFRIGPRVFVEKEGFEATGVTRNGGRIQRRILYTTTGDPTPLVATLRENLKGTIVRVQSYRETEENLGEQFERTENYLSLTGLLILVLGGVGVWNVARVFVEQKRRSVAVLKCLGANGGRIILVYILQILFLGLIGSAFGVFLAQLFLWFAEFRFADALPSAMTYTVGLWVAAQGMLLGVLISLLFSALPLMQVRNIKPRLLLHDESGERMRRLDWTKTLIGAGALVGMVVLAAWQAGSLLIGALFLVALGVTSAVLYATAFILTRILKSFGKFGGFAMSQAVNSLYRPGNQTRIILLAVGLGAFVVLGVQSLQSNLVREFDFTKNESLPSLFIVDIQRSQVDRLAKLLKDRTGEDAQIIPTVRARIAFVNGEPPIQQNTQMRQQRGQIGREFAVTYRDNLESNEKILAGKWFAGSDVAEVSVEEQMARRLNVKIGDTISFDISGKKVHTRVASVRKLDLKNTRTAFIFVFAPGVLENAPQSFAANVLSKLSETRRQKLQREIVDAFPNAQIFDVADLLQVVQNLIGNFVLAISFVGTFVILSGMLILMGSVALTKSQRIYENAILKTLGARRRTLAGILFAEYGLLGFLAGLIGVVFATALSYAVSRNVLDIEWQMDWTLIAIGILGTMVLVSIVGLASSFDVLFRKPLGTLRSK